LLLTCAAWGKIKKCFENYTQRQMFQGTVVGDAPTTSRISFLPKTPGISFLFGRCATDRDYFS
jgi:hypothetical protein